MAIDPIKVKFSYQGQECSLDLPPQEGRNLVKLFERQRGALLRVNQKGDLEEVGWSGWVSYIWNEGEEREKLTQVIERCLEALNTHLSRYQDERVARLAVQYLFDKNGDRGIGRLSQALYNPLLIQGDNKLSQLLLPEHTARVKLTDTHYVDFTDENIENSDVLPIHLGDAVSNENLWKLLVRKPGEKFCVGENASDEAVARVVGGVITKLNKFLGQRVITKAHKVVLETIFSPDSPLCRMNRRVFNRGAIAENSPIERCLHPALQEKREALVAALQQLRAARAEEVYARKMAVEKEFMDLAFEEFQFAQRLGIDLERNGDGGSGGVRFAWSRFGEKILVVKPGDEGPHGVNNPHWHARLKRWLVSPKACLEGNSEPAAEVCSWICDRQFDIWSVPPTMIRYFTSGDFAGSPKKECSVQMFVDGCTMLGEYIGISSALYGLPRPLLRWYCQGDDLRAKVPSLSLERVALHNFLIEDTDCHLDNIMVKVFTSRNTILSRIFRQDRSVKDEEIERTVATLFNDKGNQDLLNQLLFSEEITIDGRKKRIILIKHDGGSSQPKEHPGFWDFLSLRFKHLFEVLPHFDTPFQAKALIQNKEEVLKNFLREKAKLDLWGIFGTSDQNPSVHLFDLFWTKENPDLFFSFIEKDERDVNQVMTLACNASHILKPKFEEAGKWQSYFTHHFDRIHRNIKMRRESYKVLVKHMDDAEKRTVFRDVRSHADFERELANESPRT